MSARDEKRLDMIEVSTTEDRAVDLRVLRDESSGRVDLGRDDNDMNTKSAVHSTSPSGENGEDENSDLKKFYNEISNEIELVQSKIDRMKDLRDIYNENDLIFAIHERYSSWLELKKELYEHKIKDPSPGIVLYVKYIIESLIDNKLTEKEIKAYVVDACKDSFIKSTSRGTIAGLNLEVTTVCGVLAALGIIQQDAGSFSICNERLELSKFRNANSNLANEETKDTRMEIDEFISRELELIPDGVGKVLLQSISDRWKHSIPSYIEYSRKALLRQMQRDAAKAAAADEAAKALALSVANEAIASKEDNQPGDILSSDNDRNELCVLTEVGDTVVNGTTLCDNNAHVSIDSNEMEVEPRDSSSHETEIVKEQCDKEENMITDLIPNHDTGNMDGDIVTGVNVHDASTINPSTDAPNSRKRASNQRAWMLHEKFVNSELLSPAPILSKWSNLDYEEQKFLEIEESLLRRLAGQCDLPLTKAAHRIGTSYLSNSYVFDESSEVPDSNLDASSSKPLLEQVELTGNMLVDRLYKTKPKIKKPKTSHGGSYSVSSGYYNGSNIPPFLRDLNFTNFNRNPAASVKGCDLRDDYAILKSNMYLDPPLYAPYPYAMNKNQLVQATMIIPDLVVKTSEIPWEMMAEEFVPLTVEDTVDDVRVSHNGFTSSQSSPRGSAAELRRSSSGAFSDKSPRTSLDTKDKKRHSFNFENQQLSRTDSAGSIASSSIGLNDKLEVLAPLFQEIVPVTSSAFVITSDGESDEEITKDLSDNAVAAKHEEKLKYMKQRWELLQSLKRHNGHNFSVSHVDSAATQCHNNNKKKKVKSTTYQPKKKLSSEISTELRTTANSSSDSINEVVKVYENGADGNHYDSSY